MKRAPPAPGVQDVAALWNAYARLRISFEHQPTQAVEDDTVAAFERWACAYLDDAAQAHELTDRLRCSLQHAREILQARCGLQYPREVLQT